jgi:hypothetical protein
LGKGGDSLGRPQNPSAGEAIKGRSKWVGNHRIMQNPKAGIRNAQKKDT